MSEQKTFIDKAFKDKEGKLAIWQLPNIPIGTWLVATILAKIFTNGKPYNLFKSITFGALFTWAVMELFTGVNYFRRLLGLVVLIMLILSKLK